MITYKFKEQFLLFPTFGIVSDDGGVWFTVAFAYWGISFHLKRFPDD